MASDVAAQLVGSRGSRVRSVVSEHTVNMNMMLLISFSVKLSDQC